MEKAKLAFEQALTDFRVRLTSKEKEQFEVATLGDLKAQITRIQKAQDEKKQLMNFRRIQAFLEGVEQLSKVIELFPNASIYVAFVWGPVKFLLVVCSRQLGRFTQI